MNDADLLKNILNIIDVCLQGGHVKNINDAKGLIALYDQLVIRLSNQLPSNE